VAANQVSRAVIAEKRQEVEDMRKETQFLSELLVSLTKDKQLIQQSVDRLKYDHGKRSLVLNLSCLFTE
jgi:hypothetical protein